MNFNDFKDLIRNNAKNGRKTEFMKVTLSIDDYRKSTPTDYGVDETFLADFDRGTGDYIIYYPDKEEEIRLKSSEAEEEFYEKRWGTYIHK